MTASRIDFSPADEQALAQAAKWMNIVAMFHLILGGIAIFCVPCALFGAVTGLANPMFPLSQKLFNFMNSCVGSVAIIVLFAQGFQLLSAKKSLELVVTTDDQDQAHMAVTLKKLKVFFLLEVVALAFTLIGGCGGFINAAVSDFPANPMQQFQEMQQRFGGQTGYRSPYADPSFTGGYAP